MTQADDRILEVFADTGLTLTPAVLAKNVDYTRNYISDRCRALHAAGLLAKDGEGFYYLTDKGRDYLSGELNAGDLEQPSQD